MYFADKDNYTIHEYGLFLKICQQYMYKNVADKCD